LLAWCVLSIPFAAVYDQRKPSQDVALRPGQTVRVWLADGQRFEGRLVAVDSSPLVLRFAGPHPVVAIVTWGGGGVGALLGAGVGGLFPRWKRVDPERVTISFGVGNAGLKMGGRIGF